MVATPPPVALATWSASLTTWNHNNTAQKKGKGSGMFRVSADVLTAWQTWLVLGILSLVCVVYAFIVVRSVREDNDTSQASYLVVIGNLIVTAGASAIVGLSFGSESAVVVAVVVFMANAAAGWPMILEHRLWYRSQRDRERRNHQILNMLPKDEN